MEEKYRKMIDERIEYFNDIGKKFIEISNTVNGKKRVILIPMERYNKLTNKQKKFLTEG